MPFFLVLEGADGSGKTTLASLLKERFFYHEKSLVLSEPTKESSFGKKISKILQKEKAQNEEVRKELLALFYQDRLWDIKNRIRPALEQKKNVILDRYFLSTAAYQGKEEKEAVAILKQYLSDCRIPWPDCVVYLKASVEILWSRIRYRKKNLELFENQDFLIKVLKNYDEILPLVPFPVFVINANQNIEMVYEETEKILKNYFVK